MLEDYEALFVVSCVSMMELDRSLICYQMCFSVMEESIGLSRIAISPF